MGLKLPADRCDLDAAFVQNLGGKAFFLAQDAQQQMFGADMLMGQALGFFGGVGEDPLAVVGERKVDGGRDLLADGGMVLDLLPDGFDRGVVAKESVGQDLVFPEKAEQEVFTFDVRAAELAGFVAAKKMMRRAFSV